MISHTFSEKDFAVFSSEVSSWLCKLDVTGWTIEIKHEQIGSGIAANMTCNPVSKTALFRLTEHAEADYLMPTDPSALALHEVLHLMLMDYCHTVAKTGDCYHDLVVAEEHSVINRLMAVLK